MFSEGHFTHGRGNERLAALFTDESAHFRRTAGFEREDSGTFKWHITIVGCRTAPLSDVNGNGV